MADRYIESEKTTSNLNEGHEVSSPLDLTAQTQLDESQKLLAKTSVAARDILVSVTHLNLSSTTLTFKNNGVENECQSTILPTNNENENETTQNANPFSRILKLIQKYYVVLVVAIIVLVPLLIYSSTSHKGNSTKNDASHYQSERIMYSVTKKQLQPQQYVTIFQIPSTSAPALTSRKTPENTIGMKQKKDMSLEGDDGVSELLRRINEPRLYQKLAKDNFRLKSLCTNAFLAIRRNYVLARLTAEKAFTSDYSLITSIRYGNYLVLKSTSLDLYICFDTLGNLRPIKVDQLSDLCVFKSRKVHGMNEYREYVSASTLFPNSVLQFRNDGIQVNARRIATSSKACPQYSGLLVVRSQLDNIDAIEQLIKKFATLSSMISSQT